jgi:threonine/homoserine/homoserine lactone efflux protein
MMYEVYLSGLIFLVTQHIVGLIAPGPCTALVIRNSLYSRSQGLRTVLGAVLGSFSIKTLSVLGLALLLTYSPQLFQVFKVVGGAYLIFLGGQSLRRAYGEFYVPSSLLQTTENSQIQQAAGTPFLSGYLMSMANPLSSIRFVAIFSTAITADMPLPLQLSYLIILAIISFSFYMCVALFFSTTVIQEKLAKHRYILSTILGGTLIYWGIKILRISLV